MQSRALRQAPQANRCPTGEVFEPLGTRVIASSPLCPLQTGLHALKRRISEMAGPVNTACKAAVPAC